jgi:uncharacterized caspase-like protein
MLTGIPMQWLTAGLKELVHCDRMIVLLDVCHGGAAMGNTKSLERNKGVDPLDIAIGEGEVVMASSAASQISWESKNYQNGVFTRRLIEGLRQKGDKTKMDEAFAYMKARVEEEVLRDRAEVQTPIMEKKWQGEDVFLGLMPSSPRPGLVEPPATGKAAGLQLPARSKTPSNATP